MSNEGSKFQIWFFLALIVIALGFNFLIFLPYVEGLFIALIASILFRSFYERLLRLLNNRSNLTAFVTVATIVLVILVPLLVASFLLFDDVSAVYESITTGSWGESPILAGFLKIQDAMKNFVPAFSVDIIEYIQAGLGHILNNLGFVFSGFVHVIVQFLLMIVGAFYFLRDGKRFKDILIFLSPLADDFDQDILRKLSVAVGSVIKGSLFTAFIHGVLSAGGLALFAVPHPVFWGALSALLSLIPGIGGIAVLVPAVIYLVSSGQSVPAIGLAVWTVVLVGFVDNIVNSVFIVRDLKIHPFLIFLSVLGGFLFFGPIGFVAGPVALSLLFALFDIYPKIVGNRKSAV